MQDVLLYTRPGCHLCAEAAELVQLVAPSQVLTLVDIEGDIGLVSRYGVSVPVLRRVEDGAELMWPFDAQALREFLAAP